MKISRILAVVLLMVGLVGCGSTTIKENVQIGSKATSGCLKSSRMGAGMASTVPDDQLAKLYYTAAVGTGECAAQMGTYTGKMSAKLNASAKKK